MRGSQYVAAILNVPSTFLVLKVEESNERTYFPNAAREVSLGNGGRSRLLAEAVTLIVRFLHDCVV